MSAYRFHPVATLNGFGSGSSQVPHVAGAPGLPFDTVSTVEALPVAPHSVATDRHDAVWLREQHWWVRVSDFIDDPSEPPATLFGDQLLEAYGPLIVRYDADTSTGASTGAS